MMIVTWYNVTVFSFGYQQFTNSRIGLHPRSERGNHKLIPNRGSGAVTEILEAASGCYELTFRSFKALKALPGQFLQVSVSQGSDPLLRRPLSIFDLLEQEGLCKLLFQVSGRGTSLLSKLRIGDELDFIGPLGNGFTINPGSPREVLAAGGIGVAPLHYLARVLKQSGPEVVFLLGAETKKRLLALPSLRSLEVEVQVATNDGSAGRKGMVGELLTEYLRHNPAPNSIYCCGPRPMIEQVVDIAARQKIPVQASHEERMACGVGACMGCAFHHPEESTCPGDYHYYRRLCLEGPVISYRHRR